MTYKEKLHTIVIKAYNKNGYFDAIILSTEMYFFDGIRYIIEHCEDSLHITINNNGALYGKEFKNMTMMGNISIAFLSRVIVVLQKKILSNQNKHGIG